MQTQSETEAEDHRQFGTVAHSGKVRIGQCSTSQDKDIEKNILHKFRKLVDSAVSTVENQ